MFFVNESCWLHPVYESMRSSHDEPEWNRFLSISLSAPQPANVHPIFAETKRWLKTKCDISTDPCLRGLNIPQNQPNSDHKTHYPFGYSLQQLREGRVVVYQTAIADFGLFYLKSASSRHCFAGPSARIFSLFLRFAKARLRNLLRHCWHRHKRLWSSNLDHYELQAGTVRVRVRVCVCVRVCASLPSICEWTES